MSPRFPLLLISAFTSSALLLASTAGAAPKAKPKTDAAAEAAKEQAAKEQAAKEEAAKEQAANDEAAKEEAAKEQAAKDEAAKEQAAKEEATKAAVSDAEAANSPVEQAGKTYYGVGLRYRAIVVPKFMMNMFGDGGQTMVANGIGPEFIIRKDGFEYQFSGMFTGYGMEPTPFKATTDPPQSWEIVESKIKVFYLTADFMWSHSFVPQFALNYGFGAGMGIVWGDLYRTQAYPGAGANHETGEGYLECNDKGDPNTEYCGTDNDHYNNYSEPNWANGGSKPVVFPWLALQTGVRYKPHRNFIARFDTGFSTSGFFFGLGADYGL